MQNFRSAPVPLLMVLLVLGYLGPVSIANAAAPKGHTVVLGSVHKVPFNPSGAAGNPPAGDNLFLKVRPLVIDGRQREWTTAESHDVTDRSFTIRRALRINDALPGETAAHWVWQPGPWLLVDRSTGHITALHLPEFDSTVSDAVWFRDYAAYCGVATSAKGGLDAIVAQLGAKKAVVRKLIAPWPQPERSGSPCQPALWQREPMRVTMKLTGGDSVTFDVLGSTSLVEDGDGEDP